MHPCTHVHVHRIHLGSEVCLLLILSPDLLFSALTILERLEVLFQLWRKQGKGHSLNRNNFHTKSKSPKQASPLVLWIMLAHISAPVGVTQHWKSWVHDMKSMAMTMTTRRGAIADLFITCFFWCLCLLVCCVCCTVCMKPMRGPMERAYPMYGYLSTHPKTANKQRRGTCRLHSFSASLCFCFECIVYLMYAHALISLFLSLCIILPSSVSHTSFYPVH